MRNAWPFALATALLLLFLAYAIPHDCPCVENQVQIKVESWSPRIVLYRHFLNDSERVELLKLSQASNLKKIEQGPFLKEIDERISNYTLIGPEKGESIQMIPYSIGDIETHVDGHEIATFFIYLETPEVGVENIFSNGEIIVKTMQGDAILFFNSDLKVPSSNEPSRMGEASLAIKYFKNR